MSNTEKPTEGGNAFTIIAIFAASATIGILSESLASGCAMGAVLSAGARACRYFDNNDGPG